MRVKGVGPVPCRYMLIGEAPGEAEDASGKPFVGKAGQVLDWQIKCVLEPLGLARRDLYITNLVKERPPKNRDPKPEEIERDAAELLDELHAVKPEIIIPLGRFSARRMLGDWATMELVHGIPHAIPGSWVFPITHPAALLHNPELATQVCGDFRALAEWLQDPRQLTPHDEYPPTYSDGIPCPQGFVGLDTEGTAMVPWGLSWSAHPGWGAIAKGGHPTHAILHNALWDLPVLRALDVYPGNYTDTQVMAYLLRDHQSLKTLAYRHCGMRMREYTDVVGHWVEKGKIKKKKVWSIIGRTLDDIPRQEAVNYAARDADATLRIYHVLKPRIEEKGLSRLLDVEMGIVPMLDRMQTVGMQVDLEHFRQLGLRVRAARDLLEWGDGGLVTLRGGPINSGSPKQVAEWVYGGMGLKSRKKTKGGSPATTDKILQAFLHQALRTDPKGKVAQALDGIIDWRKLRKLETSFINPLPRHVAGGRFHPTLLNTRVETGRLAGKGMNPLAFPKHSLPGKPDWGKQFRRGFVAGEGRLLGSWDYSQIELRVLAHLSQDATMCGAFLRGEDLHAKLGESLYGVPRAEQTEQFRRECKVVNFSIPMGITAEGLLEQFHKNGLLDKTLDDAERILHDTLHKVYPGVWAFQEESKAEARREGMVRDMWNRLYPLPLIHSPFREHRAAAERQAAALKIQGGATCIMKLAMARIDVILSQLRAEGHYAEPWLQVHDDLLLEYDEELESMLAPLVAGVMTSATSLRVPIGVSHAKGPNWGDLA